MKLNSLRFANRICVIQKAKLKFPSFFKQSNCWPTGKQYVLDNQGSNALYTLFCIFILFFILRSSPHMLLNLPCAFTLSCDKPEPGWRVVMVVVIKFPKSSSHKVKKKNPLQLEKWEKTLTPEIPCFWKQKAIME